MDGVTLASKGYECGAHLLEMKKNALKVQLADFVRTESLVYGDLLNKETKLRSIVLQMKNAGLEASKEFEQGTALLRALRAQRRACPELWFA